MNAYYSIWRILKLKKKKKSLLTFSFYIVKIAHSSEVTYEDWIKSYLLFSKALFLDNKLDDALELLRALLDIFANIPLDEIKYLAELNKNNKISSKNNFFNFDYVLSFYSKYHVYSKCEAIFNSIIKIRETKLSRDFNKNTIFSSKISSKNNTSEKISKSLNEDYYNNNVSDMYSNINFYRDESSSPTSSPSQITPFDINLSPSKNSQNCNNYSNNNISPSKNLNNNGNFIFCY